jgi:hypothetical protein
MTATLMNTKDEFAKNPELKKEDLQELKCWLDTQEHLPSVSGIIININSSTTTSISAIRPTKPSIQWVPGFFPGIKVAWA